MILYEARCAAGVVTMIDNGIPTIVPDAKILGTGRAPNSTGIIIADQDRFWYIPLLADNIVTIVGELNDITAELLAITKNISTNAGTLIDSASSAAGAAAFVPSTVTGMKMAAEAAEIVTKITAIQTSLKQLELNLA